MTWSTRVKPTHERCANVEDRGRSQRIRVRKDRLSRNEILRPGGEYPVTVDVDRHVPGVPAREAGQQPLLVAHVLVAAKIELVVLSAVGKVLGKVVVVRKRLPGNVRKGEIRKLYELLGHRIDSVCRNHISW